MAPKYCYSSAIFGLEILCVVSFIVYVVMLKQHQCISHIPSKYAETREIFFSFHCPIIYGLVELCYLNSASGLTFVSQNINKYNCFHIDCEYVHCAMSASMSFRLPLSPLQSTSLRPNGLCIVVRCKLVI